jgi:hypothetical protein
MMIQVDSLKVHVHVERMPAVHRRLFLVVSVRILGFDTPFEREGRVEAPAARA